MVRLTVETRIQAPVELCFDLARDMNAHAQSMAGSGERILLCPPSGLLELGDEVTFEAKHLGMRQRLTSKVVEYNRPREFTDQMVAGAFKSLRHRHRFHKEGDVTLMTDEVILVAPLGPLGWLAERLFLAGYMRKLLIQRGNELKKLAEDP